MQDVQNMRNNYAADLVCLLIEKGTAEPDVGGRGSQMIGTGENAPDQAFSVIKRGHALFSWTLAHEFGHNMGACHEQSDPNCNPRFPDSHGYVQHDRQWRTIMATNLECANNGYTCQRKPFFSNPDIPYEGDFTGIPNVANNARALNTTAEVVAAFRPLSDFSWSIDIPGGSISSCSPTSDGAIRCVYLVDAPDYETRTSPESFLTISYAGNSGSSPVQVDAHQVSGTGGLPAQEEEPVVLMIDWVIYSRYHGHWKNLKYYLEYTADSSQPIVSYNAAGPIDNDFTGNEGHGIQFHHPPRITGDTLAVDLLMSGSVPDLPVQTLATVTVQLPRTFLASGNVYQPVVTAAAAARSAVLLPTFNNHSTVTPPFNE